MAQDDRRFEPFVVDTEGASAIVTPVRHVLRASIPLDVLGTCQLLEATDERLDTTLRSDSVLLAQIQEDDSRSKRFVGIEKLDEGLFGFMQLPAALVNSETPTEKFPDEPLSVMSTDFDREDWWHCFEVKDGAINAETAASILDLGPQPITPLDLATDQGCTLDEVFEHFNTVYRDTLYASKASLVFFAKSNLLKLRSTLTDQGHSLKAFAAILRSELVPDIALLDWKYKQFIPQRIQSLSRGTTSLDSLDAKQREFATSSEGKLLELWLENSCQSVDAATIKAGLFRAVNQLKTREYQLIVLVLLEYLTMWTLESAGEPAPEDIGHPIADGITAPEVLIDVLMDRLSISQSLDFSQTEDLLKVFCVEVICPFYSSKLPNLTASLLQKCVPQDLLSFEVTRNPVKPPKTKNKILDSSSKPSSRSASLKRVHSAPANLLHEKRVVPKKRALGREISMTKRAPSFEAKPQRQAAPKRLLGFEERRKQRVEKEERERVQVGQTPAKSRILEFPLLQPGIAPQLAISETSKASFMAIKETPTKSSPILFNGIAETPAARIQTPSRNTGRITQAPADGIQDSLTGDGILFKLDSPSRAPTSGRPSRPFRTSLMSSPVGPSSPDPPRLRKSVTFSETGLSRGLANPFSEHESDIDISITSRNQPRGLFGSELLARRNSTPLPMPLETIEQSDTEPSEEPVPAQTRAETLEDVLDWL